MVDVADSKSAARKSVRVRVSGEPPLVKLVELSTRDLLNRELAIASSRLTLDFPNP